MAYPEPEYRIAADEDALARAAAELIVQAIQRGGHRPAICLTGGSSVRPLYHLLGSSEYARRIPWSRVHWFVGDERFVPVSDALSNIGQARRCFLDKLAPPEHIHDVSMELKSLEGAAARYEAVLRAEYGADRLDPQRTLFALVLLGLGADGHVASLFPNSSALEDEQRWVVGVEDPALEPLVPRVTLTMPALASCQRMLLIASGRDNSAIVSRTFAGADVPAARARSIQRTTWLLDEQAGQDLPETARPLRAQASIVLLVGASGAGKSTLGVELARRLNWRFLDADDFHSPMNIDKMQRGIPLSDDDRGPWLDAIAAELAQVRDANAAVVVACSALKRHSRDMLVAGDSNTRIVYLRADAQLLDERLKARTDHFFPLGLLSDQLDVLEEPEPQEDAVTIDVDAPVARLINDIAAALNVRMGDRRAVPQ